MKTFLDSLLDAIIRLDGDALVMHVGEKPYVTTSAIGGEYRGPLSWGQVELSSRPMTGDALISMLGQILPPELQRSLAEIGAIEHEIESPGGTERFILTAARGGDDVWVEVRRRPVIPERVVVPEPVAPPETAPEAAPAQPEAIVEQAPEPETEPFTEPVPSIAAAAAESMSPPAVAAAEEEPVATERVPVEPPSPFAVEPPAPAAVEPLTLDVSAGEELPQFEVVDEEPGVVATQRAAEPDEWDEVSMPAPEPPPAPEPIAVAQPAAPELVAAAPPPPVPEPVAVAPILQPPLPPEPIAAAPPEPTEAAEAAVVVPMGRPALKLQPPPPPADVSEPAPAPPVLVDMLQKAAARGAATAYAVAGSRPFVRVEGEVVELGMEPVVTESDIERFMFEFAPRNDHGDAASEWVFSLPDVGRVRVLAFDDEAGPGLVLHIAANVSTAEQIGLSHEAQKLCSEADGLVIVTGRRRNGKSTLLGAFVDLINRRRTDYVVTIESRIRALYERRHALISQREVEGDGEAIARAARAALREGPDVLVLDDIRAPEAVAVALDAARSGRLVIAAIAAPSAAAAIDRLIDGFPTDRRPQVRALLASSLRGVVSQVLVEKKGGGRVGAREVMLGTPAVCKLVLDGATAQLGVAMESAARAGMRTLPQALAALVRDGVVEAEEAYRHVPDQRAFLMMLQRESIDVADSGRRA